MTITLFQDSNADSNDGGDDADDADDEFECDCAMCHNIGGRYLVETLDLFVFQSL